MSSESPIKKGWIGTIYGDYWTKYKKLIIFGFVVPLVFSFFILLEINLAFTMANNAPYNLIVFHNNILLRLGISTIIFVLILSCTLFLLFSFYTTSFYRLFIKPLDVVHEEIFTQEKPNPFAVLVENFFVTGIKMIKKIMYMIFLYFVLILISLPSIVVGFLGYTQIDLFFLPRLADFLSLIPYIGNELKQIILFVLDNGGREIAAAFQQIPLAVQFMLLLVPLLLMLPISDRIETSIQRKQRGDTKSIFKNGLTFIMKNLNFPAKISNFIFINLLCLFTDQNTVSLEIPVINIKNIELAIQKVLGRNQKCYTAVFPLYAGEIISKIEELPSSVRNSVVNKILEEYTKAKKERIFKVFTGMMENKSFREKMEGIHKAVGKKTKLILGVNEEGVEAYAIVSRPPPKYMTRIIKRLWCSDPTAKEGIISELRRLDAI